MSFLSSPLARYTIPFAAFLLLSFVQGETDGDLFWWLYAAKIFITGALVFLFFRSHAGEMEGRFDWRSVGVGFSVFVLWLVNYYTVYTPLPAAAAFDTSLPVLALKIAGSVLIIPLIEELFFRSFLMRYLVDSRFLAVPLGQYTAFSFWFSAVAFAAMHTPWQWGAALIAGAAYGAYLVKTKNLVGCIIAHATTNLLLALYIIITGEWSLWT